MHLHDRHEAHLTLTARLKQAGQSLGRSFNGLISAGFPYTPSVNVNRRRFRRYFVRISLHPVTNIFLIGFDCETTAHLKIVPKLRVGMPQWTLRIRFGTRSVPGCIPTRSVGTISESVSKVGTCLEAA